MRNIFYEWVGENEQVQRWMGVAIISWAREGKRTLMVMMPFNLPIAWWKRLYEWMLIGQYFHCKDCRELKRQLTVARQTNHSLLNQLRRYEDAARQKAYDESE